MPAPELPMGRQPAVLLRGLQPEVELPGQQSGRGTQAQKI